MWAAVVGGGLGGCAAAVALRAVGMDVVVFEAASAPRREGESIILLPAGTAAVAALGVLDPPGQLIRQLRMLHPVTGRTVTTLDMTAIARRLGHPYVVVTRAELLDALAASLGDHIEYGKRCVSVANTGSGAEARFADGTAADADLIVAADGTHSAIRSALWPGDTRVARSVASQGTVDLPSDYPGHDVAVITLGPGVMTWTAPTTADRVSWFVETTDVSPETAARDPQALLAPFRSWPGPLAALLTGHPNSSARTDPVYARRPPRRWGQGRVVLLGDAAHTLSPALGMGAAQAFTDAVALADAVCRCASLDDVAAAYTQRRSRRAYLTWWMAQNLLNPVATRLSVAMARPLPDRLATRGWQPIVRPDPMVLRALAGGGLRPARTRVRESNSVDAGL